LPRELGVPCSSLTSADIAVEAARRGIVARISDMTVLGDANRDCKVNTLDLIFIRNRLNQPTLRFGWL